ncbi:hypothetical protein J7T55_014699 [Diaporthe amygdali]|uniref:uncharacterized protein n=1 Tax=Phomopsis amygdali TaxID=1214568 RepID=UPI0022FE5365|nr:uncharacterized protein J7T55_014699 [Diaporthe amygdali]KAJ0107169.1 hypothetical protein J7T55_014699 [Diaporthe amygdali]
MDDKSRLFGEPQAEGPPPPSFLEATTSAGPSGGASSFQTRFACVTLNMTDRMRFINFSAHETSALRGVLGSVWPIQDVRAYGGADEIKFKGFPWQEKMNGDDMARRLIRRLLEALYDMGWVLQAAVDVSKKEMDKDSLIFRYQNPPPPPCDWLSISFDWTDKMKIVDAPPGDLTEAIIAEFRSNYRLKSHELESDRLKLKFHGQPWQATGEETVRTRMLLLSLLGILERFGYSLYASIDQVSSNGLEADVLVVTRQKGWKPGMPIWHR